MDSPCCEDCILHMDCKDCASPFSLDHRIPKSYTVKPFISGISEKVGGRVRFFFKGFCTLLPFFPLLMLEGTDRTYSGRLYLIFLVEMLPCLCKTYLSPFCQIIFVGIQVKYT